MSKVRMGLVAIAGALALLLVAAGPASAKDGNGDKIPDRWEKKNDLSLKVNQAKRDQDADGLNNRGEYRSASDPRDDDSDDDGVEDGDENAGTIASFDGTTLTIDLLGGRSISGTVDTDTEVKCGDECNQDGEEGDVPATARRHPGNSGPSGGPEDDEGDEDESGDCSVDDLVVGAAVHEAELKLVDGDAVFEEIELAR